MSQKVLVRGFKWVEYTSQFRKDFIENFKRDSDDGYFLEVDIQHPKRSLIFSQWVTLFFWNNESWKIEKLITNFFKKEEALKLG